MARDPKDNPERLVSAVRAGEEDSFELKLRPRWLGEFIGQAKAKEQLAIALEAAKSRGEALDLDDLDELESDDMLDIDDVCQMWAAAAVLAAALDGNAREVPIIAVSGSEAMGPTRPMAR